MNIHVHNYWGMFVFAFIYLPVCVLLNHFLERSTNPSLFWCEVAVEIYFLLFVEEFYTELGVGYFFVVVFYPRPFTLGAHLACSLVL